MLIYMYIFVHIKLWEYTHIHHHIIIHRHKFTQKLTDTYISTLDVSTQTHTYLHTHVQLIPLGVTFSNAVSKLKARMSVFTETWQKRRSSFEL